jgi:hypothetical protein
MDRRHVARAVGISLLVLAGCTGRPAPVTDGNASLPRRAESRPITIGRLRPSTTAG